MVLILGRFTLQEDSDNYHQILTLSLLHGDRALFHLLSTAPQFETTFTEVNFVLEFGDVSILNRVMGAFYETRHVYPYLLFNAVLKYVPHLCAEMLSVSVLYTDVEESAELFMTLVRGGRYDLIAVMVDSPYITLEHVVAYVTKFSRVSSEYGFN